jgi:hypothetical protein
LALRPDSTAATDAALLLQAERDENTCRKDFTPSEAVAIGKELEELERPKAAERKSGRPKKAEEKTPGKFPEVNGQTRDQPPVSFCTVFAGSHSFRRPVAWWDARFHRLAASDGS